MGASNNALTFAYSGLFYRPASLQAATFFPDHTNKLKKLSNNNILSLLHSEASNKTGSPSVFYIVYAINAG